ncbi:MAG: xanthine dehydrogenase family protein subunit M [Thalassobaculales bacterium]
MLEEAVGILAEGAARGRVPAILAGGTDHFPARLGPPRGEDILDITAIGALSGIAEDEGGWRIGATTTWSALAEARLPPLFDGLKAAARAVGGRQVQNRATIAGNLCNASPAADGVPPLLALDAEVELAGPQGLRRLPVAGFVLGNRRTARAAAEIVTAILVPRAAGRGGFVKLGARAYLVISIAMVAGTLELEGRLIRRARLAVGACSAAARRLPGLEAALAGQPVDRLVIDPGHFAALEPIDDIRADAAYRREAAVEATRRLLAGLAP